jgi:proteasome lid subunit RPN8/RPN11
MTSELVITSDLWDRIVSDVQKRLPEEACGLLAGCGNQVLDVIPIENVFHSPTRYRMKPQGQLSAFQHIEQKNWEMLAIYHSHPAGPGYPSNTDINEAYYPESVYIIVSQDSGIFIPRGFMINDGHILEISITIKK